MPLGPPMTGIAGLTPHLAATAGSILMSEKSLPGSPSPEVILLTVATEASVVGSTCITTSCPTRSTQWRAVPMYFEVPSVKMKFAVQPYGATMHAPAWTPVGATPGQSVLRRSSPTETPWAPAAITCWLSAGVYHAGAGRTGDEDERAAAVEAGRRAASHVRPSARRSLDRICLVPPCRNDRGARGRRASHKS